MDDRSRDARRLIAEYLTGKAVPRALLEEACQELNQSDPDAVRDFRQALRREPKRLTVLCLQFRSNLAEFCDLTGPERQQEMPELLSHVLSCADCRQTFRAMKRDEMWEMTAGPAAAVISLAQATIKDLVTRVRFTLDRVSGMLTWDQESELLFGCPSPALARIMGTAENVPAGVGEEAGPEPALRREWSVTDGETGFVFRFRSRAKPGSDMTIVELDVLSAEQDPIPHSQASIEVTNEETREIHASCPLDLLDGAPLELGPGRWSVELRCGEPPNKHRWRFHFEFQSQTPLGQ